MPRLILMLLLLIPGISHALDIENAKKINNTCALCHGVYGQGTPGTLSPRLAGLSADYLAKELEFYRSGRRNYAPMTVASSITKMTDKDIQDISEYLAGINLKHLNLPKIPQYPAGDKEIGKELFMENCKECHKKNALGNIRKGIPPLAGQYGSYIFSQMKKFIKKSRYHDDDPEDETFDEFQDEELDHLIAFVTDLPPYLPLGKTPEVFALGMAGMQGTGGAKQKEELKILAKVDGMIGMANVSGMAGMQGMSADEIEKKGLTWSKGALRISGSFRVTPTGEIVLKPTNEDLRDVAGTSGEFRIVPGGILFTPL